MIRHNPFAPADDVGCVAGLVSPRPAFEPGPTADPGLLRSRLAELVARLAARTGRPAGAVAAEWFLRYLEQVVRPVLWLDGEAGIALEAHQQNTLLLPGRRRLAVGRPLPRQPGLLLPRVPPRRTRRPAARHRRAQRHLRLRRGHRRTLRVLPRASTTCSASSAPSAPSAWPTNTLLLAAFRRFLTGAASGPAAPAQLPAGAPARLTRPALQGQPADPAARPRRTRRPGRHPVRLRHHRQPPSFLNPCRDHGPSPAPMRGAHVSPPTPAPKPYRPPSPPIARPARQRGHRRRARSAGTAEETLDLRLPAEFVARRADVARPGRFVASGPAGRRRTTGARPPPCGRLPSSSRSASTAISRSSPGWMNDPAVAAFWELSGPPRP